MKRLVSAAAAAALTAGLVLVTAGPAQAWPFNCIAYTYSSTQTAAECDTGTGTYRATCLCEHRRTGIDRRVYGPTVRVGQRSIATCANIEIPSWPGYQVISG